MYSGSTVGRSLRTAVLAAVVAASAAALAGALGMASGCAGPAPDVPDPEGVSAGVDTTRTSVFFATGRSLLEEYRVVPKDSVYRSTLDEWLEATPRENTDVAVVQPVARVRSVTLDDGVLTIDWDADVLDFEAEPSEKRLAYAAILRMYGEFPEVRQVRFTVEGLTDGETGGKDVEAFWHDVSLIGQPWDVIRPQTPPSAGETNEQSAGETTGTVEPTATGESAGP